MFRKPVVAPRYIKKLCTLLRDKHKGIKWMKFTWISFGSTACFLYLRLRLPRFFMCFLRMETSWTISFIVCLLLGYFLRWILSMSVQFIVGKGIYGSLHNLEALKTPIDFLVKWASEMKSHGLQLFLDMLSLVKSRDNQVVWNPDNAWFKIWQGYIYWDSFRLQSRSIWENPLSLVKDKSQTKVALGF